MGRKPQRLWSCIILCFVLLCILQACGSAPQAPETKSVRNTQPAVTPTPTVPAVPRKDVTFMTVDHIKLSGWLYGSGTNVIVCSHMFPDNKSDYETAAPWFAARGFMVLAYDFRGYGQSTGSSDASKNADDLLAAIAFARSKGAKKIILLGGSMGATTSLQIASRTPVTGVIALSPAYGTFLNGTITLSKEMITPITAPQLYIASQDDSGPETQAVFNDAKSPKDIHIYPGATHGTNIFSTDNGPDLIKRILTFAIKYTT